MEEPAAYGKLGLANLLELREECLREFHFFDAYRTIKQRYLHMEGRILVPCSLSWKQVHLSYPLIEYLIGRMKLHLQFYLIFWWSLIAWLRYVFSHIFPSLLTPPSFLLPWNRLARSWNICSVLFCLFADTSSFYLVGYEITYTNRRCSCC